MKPKWFFVLASFFLFFGLILSTISAVFFFNLIFFISKTHYGRMSQYRFDMMISDFPWLIVPLAVIGLGFGLFLIRKYDFSYKTGFIKIVLLYLLVIAASVFLINHFDLNRFWMGSKPVKRFYQPQFNKGYRYFKQ